MNETLPGDDYEELYEGELASVSMRLCGGGRGGRQAATEKCLGVWAAKGGDKVYIFIPHFRCAKIQMCLTPLPHSPALQSLRQGARGPRPGSRAGEQQDTGVKRRVAMLYPPDEAPPADPLDV